MTITALGIEPQTMNMAFRDKRTIPDWASESMQTAVKAGLLKGYSDNTIRPNQKVNRAEMVTILVRALELPLEKDPVHYSDKKQIAAWAIAYVQTATKHQLINGRSGNRFAPLDNARRDEVAAVLYRILTSSDTEEGTEELPVDESTDESADETDAGAGTLPPASFSNLTYDVLVKDAVMDSTKPVIYTIHDENNEVYAVNYVTKQKQRIQLDAKPEKLYFTNNKLYVALVEREHNYTWWDEDQYGEVAVIDTNRWQLKSQFEVDVDPFDIVTDQDGHIFISSGSGQWTRIVSYDEKTQAKVATATIRQQSYLAMHPQMDRIYAITTDSSPRDMEVFLIKDGKFAENRGLDSPYHGDYPMNTNMRISADGRYIMNGAGTVFVTTTNRQTNMQIVTNLEQTFTEVAFHPTKKEFYTAARNTITVFDQNTFNPIKTLKAAGEPARMFVQNNKLISLNKTYPNGIKLPVYQIQVLELQ